MAGNHVLSMGGIIIDSYLLVDEYPQKGQDTFINNCFERVGGCAINVAQTLKNLGSKTYVVSALGDDPKGETIYRYLKNCDFDTSCIQHIQGEISGYCITILDKSSERTFLTYKGCESFFKTDMVPRRIHKDISFIYLTGYYLLDKDFYFAILETLDELKTQGSKIVFDPGSLVSHVDPQMLSEILRRTDIMVPNESELTKIRINLGINDDFKHWAFKNGITHILEKQGSNGVNIWTPSDSFHVPSYRVNSIDTSGAGDSFAGGLIHCLMKNYDIKEAVDFASACGAITTTFKGPHGFFNSYDVKQLMKK